MLQICQLVLKFRFQPNPSQLGGQRVRCPPRGWEARPLFPGRVIPVTQQLLLYCLPCQASSVTGSVLGLVGPTSVSCGRVSWLLVVGGCLLVVVCCLLGVVFVCWLLFLACYCYLVVGWLLLVVSCLLVAYPYLDSLASAHSAVLSVMH